MILTVASSVIKIPKGWHNALPYITPSGLGTQTISIYSNSIPLGLWKINL